MRAKIKSVRKINEIFLCIFTYIKKSDIFSTYLNFYEFFFLAILKAKYQNVPSISNFWHLSHILSSLLADTVGAMMLTRGLVNTVLRAGPVNTILKAGPFKTWLKTGPVNNFRGQSQWTYYWQQGQWKRCWQQSKFSLVSIKIQIILEPKINFF